MELSEKTQELITRALLAVAEETSPRYNNPVEFTSDELAADFFSMKLSHKEREHFCVAFLNSQYLLIECETLFKGTINGASVYPREVVKRALELNAATVIFAHNHPSGNPKPSQADRNITDKLKDALGLVDINVLDHIVVGKNGTYSFCANGLI